MGRTNVEGGHFEKKNTEEEGAQENTWEEKGSIESGEGMLTTRVRMPFRKARMIFSIFISGTSCFGVDVGHCR